MKFSLNTRILRRILVGTTILNYLLVITYIFLLISIFLFENYYIFILSLPAYILSNSWLLLLGFFGFEGLLIYYYYWKNKRVHTEQGANPRQDEQQRISIENFSLAENELLDDQTIDVYEMEVEEADKRENPSPVNFPLKKSSPTHSLTQDKNIIQEDDLLDEEEEVEFDKLWEEAINHVKNATSNDKKKATNLTSTEKDIHSIPPALGANSFQQPSQANTTKNQAFGKTTPEPIHSSNKTKSEGNNFSSYLKPEHREFYNELAMNNWIYQSSADREKILTYKPALDETRFFERDIKYLIDSKVIYKLLMPFSSGSFYIYSLYEQEDKKIVTNYIANLCKKLGACFSQKTVSIVNFQELGLEKKTLRLDFQINNEIFGLIWLNNFLMIDEQTRIYSLTFDRKKEVKALIAATQVHQPEQEGRALILTDHRENVELISSYIHSMGFGEVNVLALSEKDFEKDFKVIIKK